VVRLAGLGTGKIYEENGKRISRKEGTVDSQGKNGRNGRVSWSTGERKERRRKRRGGSCQKD
jgi:hypothetical protein